MKKFMTLVMGLMVILAIAGCTNADVVSQNISKEADQFNVLRRVVFYNGINGEYILSVEGYCSLGNYDKDGELSVTCKDNSGGYRKHYLGLSDNVTYFAEQIDASNVSADHYKVIFKPSVIVPDIELH